MQEVAEKLGLLGSRLEGLQSGLGEAAVRMAQSADAMANRMGEGAEAALSKITNQIGGLATGLRNFIDQTTAAGANAGRDMSERIEAAAKMFEQAARDISDRMAAAVAGMEARMGEQAEQGSARLSAPSRQYLRVADGVCTLSGSYPNCDIVRDAPVRSMTYGVRRCAPSSSSAVRIA
jgi:hypothetical protein